MITAYHRRLTSPDPAVQLEAAKAWSIWEGTAISLLPDPARVAKFGQDDYAIAFARIECHYFVNAGFFERDDQLIANAGLIRHIPGVIIQGRYDVVTPMRTAWDLHQAWPEADFRIVRDAGHAVTEPGVTAEIVAATDRLKTG
jgi:proline iminopeptidase